MPIVRKTDPGREERLPHPGPIPKGWEKAVSGPEGPESRGGLMGLGLQPAQPQKSMVTLQIGGKPVSFLVDTGATYSILTKPMGQITTKKTSMQGAMGKSTLCPWTSKRTVDLGKSTVTHSFLVIRNVLTPF